MLTLLIDSLYGINRLLRSVTLVLIDIKSEFVNKCKRNYLDIPDSAIFQMITLGT